MQRKEPDKARILVVDDNKETLAMLTDALEIEGMDVTVAENGHHALKAADQTLPDVVLMDAMMTGMNGFEACQILKEDKGFVDVPVIFMTGFDESEHMARAFESGAVDYIAKPISLDELFARIKVHMSNAQRAKSVREALDRAGRSIVACDTSGIIQWSTPQAADLMNKHGFRVGESDRLPLEVIYWLTETIAAGDTVTKSNTSSHSLTIPRQGGGIEFRLLDDSNDNEILLRLVDSHEGSEAERLASAFGLTAREAEVLLWITHSKSNKEIAQILSVSPRTVNTHLEQIFIKLGVENRTAAATSAIRVLLSHL